MPTQVLVSFEIEVTDQRNPTASLFDDGIERVRERRPINSPARFLPAPLISIV
jgi:hypothetical protein